MESRGEAGGCMSEGEEGRDRDEEVLEREGQVERGKLSREEG